ncbi:MAG TPA: DUF1684 domain-containing protein [Actinomycetales bacterium]|nr:DUF1684 domain-containing protein [Actinomycetales bacterium]
MSLELLDWRRRTFDLYARVRELAHDDPAAAHRSWVSGRDVLFGEHPQSPLLPEHRSGFAGFDVAPYDPEYRFEVAVDPAPAERFEVETGTDGRVAFDRLGVVELPGLGSLDVWWLVGYGGGVFVPFRDGTSGREGYGGGRYLLDTVKGADLGGSAAGDTNRRVARLVIDLNFAYHPSCAYDPAWACPLAPRGNWLAADVPVGERYTGPWAEKALVV